MNAEVVAFLEKAGYKPQDVRSIQLYSNFNPDGAFIAQEEADFSYPGVEVEEITPVASKYTERDLVVLENTDGYIFIFSPGSWDIDHLAVPVYTPAIDGTEEVIDMEGIFAVVDRSYPFGQE